ncbi:MAG: hypothetical protein WA691_01270 [Thermoplasmata archaeon]
MDAVRDVSPPLSAGLPTDFDPFGVAVGLAVIAGALALLAPYLNALTAALAALAGAGWVAGRAGERTRGSGWLLYGRAAAIGFATLGTGAFFLLPEPFTSGRGLALALSLVPLWVVERRRRPAGEARSRRLL